VGVVLLGELPVGALDVALGRVLSDAEHLVVVLLEPFPRRLGHARAQPLTVTMAGRRRLPFHRYPDRNSVRTSGPPASDAGSCATASWTVGSNGAPTGGATFSSPSFCRVSANSATTGATSSPPWLTARSPAS